MKVFFFVLTTFILLQTGCSKSENHSIFNMWELVSIKTSDMNLPLVTINGSLLFIAPSQGYIKNSFPQMVVPAPSLFYRINLFCLITSFTH